MKVTYQKEGTAQKHSLKKIQSLNLFLWKIFLFTFFCFCLLGGLLFLINQKEPLDFESLPELTPEETKNITHSLTALEMLKSHKAPSISLAILSQSLLYPEKVTSITYRDLGTTIQLTFIFETMTKDEINEEQQNLLRMNFFEKIETSFEALKQKIIITSSDEFFLYENTLSQDTL